MQVVLSSPLCRHSSGLGSGTHTFVAFSSLELLALGDGVGLSKNVWGKVPRMQHGLNHFFVKTSLDSLFKCALA